MGRCDSELMDLKRHTQEMGYARVGQRISYAKKGEAHKIKTTKGHSQKPWKYELNARKNPCIGGADGLVLQPVILRVSVLD